MIGVLALASCNSALAADIVNKPLNLGATATFNHVQDTGAFTDTGILHLDAGTSVYVSTLDSQVVDSISGSILNVSEFAIYDHNNALVHSLDDLTNYVFSLGTLIAGDYTLTYKGTSEGVVCAVNDISASAVPLPSAAWLFGAALIGFVTFSSRRSV